MKKTNKKLTYFKVHMWGQIAGFIWKKQVKIKQNNAAPTFHANFYTTNSESAVDFKNKHMIWI